MQQRPFSDLIAVEIPAALAADPQIVPVDKAVFAGACLMLARTDPTFLSLVGQRVALAWRETCPTCDGGCDVNTHIEPNVYLPCSACDGTGSRMVVGWTAEVEAVVPIEAACHTGPPARSAVEVLPNGTVILRRHIDHHTWSSWSYGPIIHHGNWLPGQYALVLHKHNNAPLGALPGDLVPVLPFSGFAEVSRVADTDG